MDVIINCAQFYRNRLRGLDFVGVVFCQSHRKAMSPLTHCVNCSSHCDSLVINILCATYFVTSITIPDLRRSIWVTRGYDVSAPSAISSPWQAVNFIPKPFFQFVQKNLTSIFSRFSCFQSGFYHIHWVYLYCGFKHSKCWRHKLVHTLIETYNVVSLIL